MDDNRVKVMKKVWKEKLESLKEETGECEFANNGCKLYCRSDGLNTVGLDTIYRAFVCETAKGFVYEGDNKKEMCQLKELLLKNNV